MATSVPAAIEPEPSDAQPRNLWVAARLGAGATAFFYLAFAFAYFYLRSVDTKAHWKIGSVHPSSGMGIAIVLTVTLSAVVARAGRRTLVLERRERLGGACTLPAASISRILLLPTQR